MARGIFILGFLVMLIMGIGLEEFALAAEKIKFANSTPTSPLENLPPLAAEEKGFFKEEGVDVERVIFGSGAAHWQAAAAGSTQIGISGTQQAIHSISRGVRVVVVADTGASQDFVVWVRGDSLIKDPKELSGRRIGVGQLGSLGHIYGRVAFKALGLEKDVRFVGTGGVVNAMAALKAGSVDAIILTHWPMATLRFEGQAKEILNINKTFIPKEWTDLTIFALIDFVEKSPEVTRKIVKAVVKGGQYVMKDRNWAVEKMRSVFRYPPQVAEQMYDYLRYGPDGKISRKSVETVRDFMVEYGLIARDQAPPLEKIYTTVFTQ